MGAKGATAGVFLKAFKALRKKNRIYFFQRFSRIKNSEKTL